MTAANLPYAKMKKILIITSSGGGGLIQAANAKEQEIRLKYPNLEIVRRDVLKDWVGKWLGSFSVAMWNSSQRKGNVAALKLFGVCMSLTDFLFSPQVFYWTLKTLFKEDIDHVIDTQPLCTAAIVKALRFFHWKRGKKVCLEKVLVDLPTRKATHFFRPIRKLSEIDRSHVRVTTIAPYLEEGETPKEFWRRNCRITEDQVNYEPFFVRQSFCKYHKKPLLQEPFQVKAQIKNSEELQLIQKCVGRGPIEAKWGEKEVEFSIAPQDRVFTILLGSQPAFDASLNYVRKFLQIGNEHEKSGIASHLFIFCANHRPKEHSLLRSVSELVTQTKDYPKAFTVIPLSFQNDDVIAPLFYRSNRTCTRSGGQTLMELMCVSPGEIWIHSEAKKRGRMTQKDLLAGIPGWESANAVYMQKMYGAKIVTPETFGPHAKKLFSY
jgi:hypothetical protein